MKDNTIYQTLKEDLKTLIKIEDLSTFWNDRLFDVIKECKTNHKSTQEDCRNLIEIVFIYNGKCLNGYTKLLQNDKENTKDAKLFYTFVEASHTHLNLLQDKLNGLIYKQSTFRFWIGVLIAIITSIISIAITCYYGKNPLPCSCCSSEPPKIEMQQTISEIDSSTIGNSVIPLTLDTNKIIK
ncbi:MAG: hypothetical protein LBU51_11315 [Bacteroidales bacterium]|jgi:hypothetical protein|nr:hypothetical protein [Bacteroidales bacterium]